MNGNKFATGEILRKPVEVVKGRILAGWWAQKPPGPCTNPFPLNPKPLNSYSTIVPRWRGGGVVRREAAGRRAACGGTPAPLEVNSPIAPTTCRPQASVPPAPHSALSPADALPFVLALINCTSASRLPHESSHFPQTRRTPFTHLQLLPGCLIQFNLRAQARECQKSEMNAFFFIPSQGWMYVYESLGICGWVWLW